MMTIRRTGEDQKTVEITFRLPEALTPQVMEVISKRSFEIYPPTLAEPRLGKISYEEELAQLSICPVCDSEANTIAAQLTYQEGEPHALYLWCLDGHAWKWTSIHGRVRIPGKWQR